VPPDRAQLKTNYDATPTEDLVALYDSKALTDVAYDALEEVLSGRGFTFDLRGDGGAAKSLFERFDGFMGAHWRGERSLASAFWLVGLVGTGLIMAATIASDMVFVLFLPVPWFLQTVLVMGIFGAPLTAYLVFAWVSIWRCVWNTPWPVFGYIARFIVVISALRYADLFAVQFQQPG